MRKFSYCCFLLLPCFLFGTEPQLDIIGFSSGSRYLAYSLSGEYEGSAFPFCELYILSTETNWIELIYAGVDENQSMSSSEFRDSYIMASSDRLDEYGIEYGNSGIFLEFPALDSPPEMDMLSFYVGTSTGNFEEGLYSIDLFQSVVDSSYSYFGMQPSTCTLHLTATGDCHSVGLLEWESDPLIDRQAYDFQIERVLLGENGVLVVFLSVIVEGFEIPETEVVPLVFDDLDGVGMDAGN